MSNLCTYIIFTYTCIWIENSLERCVLKYQERWFLSGETEIISALFFIPFSTFDFSKMKKFNFFSYFLNSSLSKDLRIWKLEMTLGISLTHCFCCCHKSWFGFLTCNLPMTTKSPSFPFIAAAESLISPNIYPILTLLIIKLDPVPTSNCQVIYTVFCTLVFSTLYQAVRSGNISCPCLPPTSLSSLW